MEQGNVYIDRCSHMKANMSAKSTGDDNVASTYVAQDGTCTDWRYNACVEPFWKQYSYIASWIRTCQRNFRLSPCKPDFRDWCRLMTRYHAMMANYMQWNYMSMMATTPQQLGYDCHNAAFLQNMTHSQMSTPKFCKECGRGRRRRNRRKRARKQTLSSSGDFELHIANIDPDGGGLDVELGGGNDNMEFEFEITEDLVEFFAETARHRKQRELLKVAELTEAKNDETTNADLCSETAVRIQPTVLPPREQLGARRLSEMRELYGTGAAMIHGMETAMQLSFDRNTDRHKPRPWPALPLNIQFD